jgi:hypothetical protein
MRPTYFSFFTSEVISNPTLYGFYVDYRVNEMLRVFLLPTGISATGEVRDALIIVGDAFVYHENILSPLMQGFENGYASSLIVLPVFLLHPVWCYLLSHPNHILTNLITSQEKSQRIVFGVILFKHLTKRLCD